MRTLMVIGALLGASSVATADFMSAGDGTAGTFKYHASAGTFSDGLTLSLFLTGAQPITGATAALLDKGGGSFVAQMTLKGLTGGAIPFVHGEVDQGPFQFSFDGSGSLGVGALGINLPAVWDAPVVTSVYLSPMSPLVANRREFTWEISLPGHFVPVVPAPSAMTLGCLGLVCLCRRR